MAHAKLLRPALRSGFFPGPSRFVRSVGTVLFLCAFLVSCKKPQRTYEAKEAHVITRELARAAAAAAPAGSDIRTKLSADSSHPRTVDHLYVTLRGRAGQPDRVQLTRLIRALDSVATGRGLTRSSLASSGTVTRFEYRRAGVATQSVLVVAVRPPGEEEPAAAPLPQGNARLAIILDDLGGELAPADSIFELRYPLTISVLPNLAHSTEIAEEAAARGYQVLLHLPMQSVGEESPEPLELRSGLAAEDVSRLVNDMLSSVPTAAGVNNHQGSLATADPVLMSELMPVLVQRRLFFIDSRTTAATVAYDTARRAGVAASFRNVPFLDDVAEPQAVREQFERAIRDARLKGSAIAIGHPRPATLELLRQALPQLGSRGVRPVYASELVQ